jgi:hypothetical protein
MRLFIFLVENCEPYNIPWLGYNLFTIEHRRFCLIIIY